VSIAVLADEYERAIELEDAQVRLDALTQLESASADLAVTRSHAAWLAVSSISCMHKILLISGTSIAGTLPGMTQECRQALLK
jgi:hypothetical protein